jgi:hypothetical protein
MGASELPAEEVNVKSLFMAAALAATVTTGVGVALPAAEGAAGSVASTVVLVDGGGDVWTYSDTTIGYTPASRPDADVLRARISLGDHALNIRMSFDNLRRVATQWYRADVRTPDGTFRYVLEAKSGHWAGQMFRDVKGEWEPEASVGYSIDYFGDVVGLRLPYSTLGDPTWVQVRLRNDLGAPGGETFFTDNPSTHGERPSFTGRLGCP